MNAKSVGVFWVPKEARWDVLKKNARQPTIGKTVDDAMEAIERGQRGEKEPCWIWAE